MTPSSIPILLVGTRPEDDSLLREEFDHAGVRVEISRVESAEDLHPHEFSTSKVVVLRAGRDPMNSLSTVKLRAPGVPVIVLADWIDAARALEYLHAGAADCIEQPAAVAQAIREAVEASPRAGRGCTDRSNAEAALQVSEARLRGIMDLALDAIVSVDEARRIIDLNPAAERMFGQTRQQLLGEH
jgi:PAS domain-containing protein